MVCWIMTILETSVWALIRFLITWMQRLPSLQQVTTEKRKYTFSKVQTDILHYIRVFLLNTFEHTVRSCGKYSKYIKLRGVETDSFSFILLISPGDQYYMYEFLHQPSHEECITMSERSPSTLFRRYTDVYYNNYERVFRELFSDCELLYIIYACLGFKKSVATCTA